MKKTIKNVSLLLLIGLVAYNSLYFKKLDEVKLGKTTFNPAKYAAAFWQNQLLPATKKAIEIDQLLTLLNTSKDQTFSDYSHAVGIGNVKYFLIKGSGIVSALEENFVKVKTQGTEVTIATEYVFGNAVRDAPGVIDINAFANSMDFNNVSAEINKRIREQVIPPFRTRVKKGDQIAFSGAIELNREHPALHRIEVLPIGLEIISKN